MRIIEKPEGNEKQLERRKIKAKRSLVFLTHYENSFYSIAPVSVEQLPTITTSNVKDLAALL